MKICEIISNENNSNFEDYLNNVLQSQSYDEFYELLKNNSFFEIGQKYRDFDFFYNDTINAIVQVFWLRNNNKCNKTARILKTRLKEFILDILSNPNKYSNSYLVNSVISDLADAVQTVKYKTSYVESNIIFLLNKIIREDTQFLASVVDAILKNLSHKMFVYGIHIEDLFTVLFSVPEKIDIVVTAVKQTPELLQRLYNEIVGSYNFASYNKLISKVISDYLDRENGDLDAESIREMLSRKISKFIETNEWLSIIENKNIRKKVTKELEEAIIKYIIEWYKSVLD